MSLNLFAPKNAFRPPSPGPTSYNPRPPPRWTSGVPLLRPDTPKKVKTSASPSPGPGAYNPQPQRSTSAPRMCSPVTVEPPNPDRKYSGPYFKRTVRNNPALQADKGVPGPGYYTPRDSFSARTAGHDSRGPLIGPNPALESASTTRPMKGQSLGPTPTTYTPKIVRPSAPAVVMREPYYDPEEAMKHYAAFAKAQSRRLRPWRGGSKSSALVKT
eukprot:NODE_3069_length_1056_cov_54.315789_g2817_i0.p1 GENE.NODE_3069_length_1056_cov_54.315789_g2817_i0~~NODE_3069_length_1056_cov_54.315789_g2817_i0.p1  ORF type:complete len:215 (-),score=2.31 NODE_3069_length_1056_cov_54.315789_g2817_i0:196-840(-)